MSHVLRLAYGPITISLSDNSGVLLENYVPKTPEIASTTTTGDGDGGELANIRYGNVTETIELTILGIAPIAIRRPDIAQGIVGTINKYMDIARRRQKIPTGDRMYLEMKLDTDSHYWRTEILAGKLELDRDALQVWGQAMIRAKLHITRRPFWERTGSLTELRVATKLGTSPIVGGRTIHNQDTGSVFGNYVQISGTEVVGDLPSPAKIELTNDTGASQDYHNIYIANNAFDTASALNHAIEGESAMAGTQVNSATCSGGKYMQTSFSGSTYFQWQLPTNTLYYTGGRHFRLLARFATYPISTPVYVKPALAEPGGSMEIVSGEEILLPVDSGSIYQLVDLGSLPLPPNGNGLAWNSLTLKLNMRSASNATVGIDFIQLFPTEEFRHLRMRAGQLIAGGAIVDDGADGKTYIVEGGANKPYFSPRGSFINVYPGITQRIHVLHDEGTNMDIANTFSVRVWYRPRRLTI